MYYSIMSMSYECRVRCLLLDHPDPFLHCAYPGFGKLLMQTFMASLVLWFWLGWQIGRPGRLKEGRRLRAEYLCPGSFHTICLSLAVSPNWRPLLSQSPPVLYFLLNFGHRFLSLDSGRVTAPLLLKLGYRKCSLDSLHTDHTIETLPLWIYSPQIIMTYLFPWDSDKIIPLFPWWWTFSLFSAFLLKQTSFYIFS